MAAACVAVAFLGFAPTYWVPMAEGKFNANPIVHIHGMVFFAWTLFFVFQTWLATSRRIARHRTWGMVGISSATAMTIFGTLATINTMKIAAALGLADAGYAFAIVPLSGIVFFAIVFTVAVANVRQPELHKRLMLLATISILEAPVARWFLTFLAPPGPPGPLSCRGDHRAGLDRPSASRHRHRVIRARAGVRIHLFARGGALLALKMLQLPFSATPIWHSIAGRIWRSQDRASRDGVARVGRRTTCRPCCRFARPRQCPIRGS